MFAAFGRDFKLVLEPNDALIQRLSADRQDALDAIELYRGRIVNVKGSWARISRSGNEVSGLIFDGAEYFAIDSFDHVADKLTVPGDVEGAVIYRLHDTVGLIRDDVTETGALTGVRAAVPQRSTLTSPMSGTVLGQKIDIGVVGDFEFTQLVGASTAADSMIRLINIVDGIFLEGLGVHIDLVELQSYDVEPDPFTSSKPGILLGELGDLKFSSDVFRPLGLLHLFTGRDLEDASSSVETLGIAHIGTLCDPGLGVSLTQSSGGSAIDAVVAAHEIGHNFGAPHDAEPGSACATTPAGMLMDASLSGSTEFSQCSIDQVRIEVASAACMTTLLPANLSLLLLSDAPPPVVDPDVGYTFNIAIENTSGVDAVDARLIVDAPSMSVVLTDRRGAVPDICEKSATPYSCYWSELANGERFEATISFRAREQGPASIDVGVTSLTESDLSGDNLHFEVEVLPYVNLAASIYPSALSLRPAQEGSVTMTVRNIGTESANQAVARVVVGQKLDFLEASIGECLQTDDAYLISYDCPLGTVPPGSSVDFDVDFRVRADQQIGGAANIGVWAMSLEPESTSDRQDNSFFTKVTFGDATGDLVIEQGTHGRVFEGDTVFVVVDVRNDGPDTIQDVVVELKELSGSAEPELQGVTATGAFCQPPLSAGDTICDIAQLASGDEVRLRFSITTSDTGDIRFHVEGKTSSSDPNVDNNGGWSYATVLPQPPPPASVPAPSPPPVQENTGGGGGGGATDPFVLLCLLSLLGIAPQRRVVTRSAWVGRLSPSLSTTGARPCSRRTG